VIQSLSLQDFRPWQTHDLVEISEQGNCPRTLQVGSSLYAQGSVTVAKYKNKDICTDDLGKVAASKDGAEGPDEGSQLGRGRDRSRSHVAPLVSRNGKEGRESDTRGGTKSVEK